jgi:phenylalanyl-tRNA synthetase beta chain
MRVSLSWLNEFIDLSDLSVEKLADKLDLTGTAIESVESPGKGLDKIVIGQVAEISSHPNADKLSLVKVNIDKEILDIVCGAKNFKVGDKVPVALVGAVMPSGMEIKPAKIRGEKSFGMMCSERELNIGEGHQGIMILAPDVVVGEPLTKALGLDDYILDLEITPNRPDSMSVVGIARECAAILDRPYKMPEVESGIDGPAFQQARQKLRKIKELVSVEIKDPDLCPRYTAKVITGVEIGPSPQWMQQRIIAAGGRPINNLVDVTNYVLYELGQPLHAFDYDLIPEGKIIVRRALKDEKIVTLDDIERKLLPDTLVIADKNAPIALAGVMGGLGSEVNENTKTILLESAYFSPKNISRTSRELGLISESSMRFERSIDPNNVIFASQRACCLYEQVAGGKTLEGVIDEYPKKINPVTIDLRPERVNKILGTSLNEENIIKILKSLELKVAKGEELSVTVPTFRPDLEREIDLIEEVARLYGLNNIASTLPKSSEKQGKLTDEQKNQEQVRDLLIAAGYFETLNYGFTDVELIKALNFKGDVEITNPLSSDLAIMRPSLIPGLIKNTINNIRYGNENLKLFEIGYVFEKRKDDVPREIKRLALLGAGSLNEKSWSGKLQMADFYFLKGTLEVICESLQIDSLIFQKEDNPLLEKGQGAAIYFGEEKAGYIGMVSREILEKLNLPENVFVAEIDYQPLFKYAKSQAEYIPISKYPGITLDLAILVDADISHHQINQVIREAGEELLKDVKLFDLYTGKGIPEGKKSMAYSLFFQAFDRTLKTEEAVTLHDKVKKALVDELGAEIR